MTTADSPEFLRFKRGRFAARFPRNRLYTLGHFWLLETAPRRWRAGLTQFATRMLGEIVEFDFEVKPGAPVRTGELVGWIEGFKAVSDLYCAGDGFFAGGNAEALADASLVCADPYGRGWLYEFEGDPEPGAAGPEGYEAHLTATIDKMTEKESAALDGDPAGSGCEVPSPAPAKEIQP